MHVLFIWLSHKGDSLDVCRCVVNAFTYEMQRELKDDRRVWGAARGVHLEVMFHLDGLPVVNDIYLLGVCERNEAELQVFTHGIIERNVLF